jgi:hypothetical protein
MVPGYKGSFWLYQVIFGLEVGHLVLKGGTWLSRWYSGVKDKLGSMGWHWDVEDGTWEFNGWYLNAKEVLVIRSSTLM